MGCYIERITNDYLNRYEDEELLDELCAENVGPEVDAWLKANHSNFGEITDFWEAMGLHEDELLMLMVENTTPEARIKAIEEHRHVSAVTGSEYTGREMLEEWCALDRKYRARIAEEYLGW